VLDRLSRQTQMKIVYDGAPPRQTVTLDLRGRTVVEAVVAALEGQGVNYALAMDASGTRVETLLVSGSATTTATASAGRNGAAIEDRRSAAREMPPPEPVIEEPEPVAEEEGAPADTSAGLNMNAAGQGSAKEAQPTEPAAPPEAGLGGFAASPFAPRAAKPETPQPQATPPPFNP
jgi:hypothetical protein